jgi:hypothetical protein
MHSVQHSSCAYVQNWCQRELQFWNLGYQQFRGKAQQLQVSGNQNFAYQQVQYNTVSQQETIYRLKCQNTATINKQEKQTIHN